VGELRGVTLPDAGALIMEDSNCLIARRGSLLFAHFGLTGPVILDISRIVSGHPRSDLLQLELDLIPNRGEPDLDDFLRTATVASGKKQLASVVADLVPRRLAETVIAQCGMSVDRKAAALTKVDRARIVQSLKRLSIPISGTLGYKKAEVTAGGVALDEVDSRTMRSKRVPHLFIAGEVLDLDGPIGGYNFQAAFSTGWLAGENS
jgi:predicted Rossmann fold flavoprotein